MIERTLHSKLNLGIKIAEDRVLSFRIFGNDLTGKIYTHQKYSHILYLFGIFLINCTELMPYAGHQVLPYHQHLRCLCYAWQ